MNIGVIGSGNIGGTLATLWVKAGHSIMLSSRHPEKLKSLAERIGEGVSYGSVDNAAVFGEVILLAIPMYGIIEAFPRIRESLIGKIIIDAMNFFEHRDGKIVKQIRQFKGTHSAFTASKLPGTRLVKAFNTIYVKTLETQSHRPGDALSVPFAADDEKAKAVVQQLIKDTGFEPCDVGTLDDTAVMQPGELLWTKELTLFEMKELLAS
jgi:predicted dinucleotide-binding enzyme